MTSDDSLATACGLFCGFCRFYMNDACKKDEKCMGCGSESRAGCAIYKCCRVDKGLRFCTECEDFACAEMKNSAGLHPHWVAELEKLPPRKHT